jgi:uncharacterized protein (DUF362 family)
MLSERTGAIVEVRPEYPKTAPYHPGESYPEYIFRDVDGCVASAPNHAYEAVREAFHTLGFDAGRFGSPEWNPLGHLVEPGSTVLLKPNYVRNFHELTGKYCESLITHGSIIRALLDYVAIALAGRGRVVIADSSQNDAVFSEILRLTGIPEIQALYSRTGISIEAYDLRIEYVHKVEGVLVRHDKLPGDPRGYATVDLGAHSMFEPVSRKARLFRGAEYSLSEMQQHHQPGRHEYPVCRTILDADVLINLPKLKTHKKAGVTLSLKNMIGINGNKNWLPHHTEGVPAQGGDQFDTDAALNRFEHGVLRAFKEYFPRLGPLKRVIGGPAKRIGRRIFGDTNVDRVRSGNWWGNDTIWRTCIDLKRILLYADREGRMTDRVQRRYFTLIDGLVGGEGNGPLAPDDKPCGLVIASHNPAIADAIATHIMGFDWRHIPIIHQAFQPMPWPVTTVAHGEIACISNVPDWRGPLAAIPGDRFNFQPHFGWTKHIRPADSLEPTPVIA